MHPSRPIVTIIINNIITTNLWFSFQVGILSFGALAGCEKGYPSGQVIHVHMMMMIWLWCYLSIFVHMMLISWWFGVDIMRILWIHYEDIMRKIWGYIMGILWGYYEDIVWILVKWQCVDMIAEILISSDRNKALRTISLILNFTGARAQVHWLDSGHHWHRLWGSVWLERQPRKPGKFTSPMILRRKAKISLATAIVYLYSMFSM